MVKEMVKGEFCARYNFEWNREKFLEDESEELHRGE